MIRLKLDDLMSVSPKAVYRWTRSKLVGGQHPKWQCIKQGLGKGIELYVPWRSSNFREMVTGDYDRFLFDTVAALDELQGSVIWDVGAHIGYSALLFSSLVGEHGRVVAFEPNPANRRRLHMHIDRNPHIGKRIITVDIALSDKQGSVQFQSHNGVDGGQSFGGYIKGTETALGARVYGNFESIEVLTDSADNLVATGRLPAPSIIKIDVEGAECVVLEGASQLLSEQRPLILLEVHHVKAMFDCLTLLHSLGYLAEMLDVASTSRCFIAARHKSIWSAAS